MKVPGAAMSALRALGARRGRRLAKLAHRAPSPWARMCLARLAPPALGADRAPASARRARWAASVSATPPLARCVRRAQRADSGRREKVAMPPAASPVCQALGASPGWRAATHARLGDGAMRVRRVARCVRPAIGWTHRSVGARSASAACPALLGPHIARLAPPALTWIGSCWHACSVNPAHGATLAQTLARPVPPALGARSAPRAAPPVPAAPRAAQSPAAATFAPPAPSASEASRPAHRALRAAGAGRSRTAAMPMVIPGFAQRGRALPGLLRTRVVWPAPRAHGATRA